jgi:hypothetical protein
MSVFRAFLALHMRYQAALARATLEYLQGLFTLLRRPVRAATQPIVLEGASGEQAVGAFAVANHLPRPVTATFDLSPFRDERGRPARVALEVHPPRVSLGAAQQAVVRIAAAITDDLAASTSYSGFVSVPGIADHPIPIIVRRTA